MAFSVPLTPSTGNIMVTAVARNEVRIEHIVATGTHHSTSFSVTPNATHSDGAIKLMRRGALKMVPCGGGMQSFFAPVGTVVYTIYPENSGRVWRVTVGSDEAVVWHELPSREAAALLGGPVAPGGGGGGGGGDGGGGGGDESGGGGKKASTVGAVGDSDITM